jgi:hypothetical protein
VSTVDEMRESAKQAIDDLPREQLVAAAEFLRFLRDRASDEATAELLRIPGLLEDLQQAERDLAKGRGTPVEQLRRKYRRNA